MRYQGKIHQWFEEEGYGFILRDDAPEPVLLNISAIFHGQSKPKQGDLVTFEIEEIDQVWQAKNLLYVSRPKAVIKPARFEQPPRKKNYTALIMMVIFGFLMLKFMAPREANVVAPSENVRVNAASGAGD